MKIWSLEVETDKYNSISVKDDKHLEIYKRVETGESLITNWNPIEINVSNKRKENSDYPFGLSCPVLSKRAIDILNDLIHPPTEFLPLISDNMEYFILNTLNLVDCLNDSKSVPEQFYGIIVDYEKFSFILDKVKGQHLFKLKIPNTNRTLKNRVFVSDFFKETVLKNNLKGFKFIEVWDSENEEKDCNLIFTSHPVETHEEELDFDTAMKLVLNENKEVISQQWRVKLNKDKKLTIGILKEDNSYEWINPIYYPPIFLTLKWKIVK